jgi:hypothetical protein
MTSEPASFRELKGIGPATEARLHEAGVTAWEALSAVVDALAATRAFSGDTRKDLAGALADRVEVGGRPAPHPTASDPVPEPAPDPIPEPAPVPEPAPARARSDFAVMLDAGRALGGARRTVELTVDAGRAPGGAGPAGVDYRATLAGRAYGQATAAGWAALATQRGRGRRPGRLPLRFEAVELPEGLQRLRLELTLHLAEPALEPPVLALA